MISMRAMGLENQIEAEFERFEQLRSRVEELIPSDLMAEDKYGWVYGKYLVDEKEGFTYRDDSVDQYERLDEVRELVLELLDSTYRLEGLLGTRGTLMS